ncbi:alanine racemase [Desulfovibrio ferrophilus]|uniref:Alanine racemase n=1 Tax=Desulfovibrio ferrophilus TaxID=241368 RepID=A0A2Z6AXH5_9BACT|nr:alanine racemase [Desulfovibrio ferrophilus]BBD07954.1 alanine racemase [Desulfovibrio ferrophilus]
MSIGYNHVRARIHVRAIADNFLEMNRRGGNCYGVVKSDAYGHGLAVVAEALAGAGAKTLAVGTVEEAASLANTTFTGRVVALLGAQLPEDYPLAVAHDVICFCGRREQLRRLNEAAVLARRKARVSLKFDTGMRRLGFLPEEASEVLELVQSLPNLEAIMVSSHLATADEPEQEAHVHEQGARFKGVVDVLRAGGLEIEANLCNSAALLAFPEYHFDGQRPGISLYGGNPFYGTSREELGCCLRPTMEVTSRIYQVHDLKAGEGINYGLTYRAERDMRVAIVGVGYADNYSRNLSSKGWMVVGDKRVPVVGRVCMQMTAVDVTDVADARAGDTVWLLGGNSPAAISACELAEWWGTISYEVYCLMGMNPREYLLDRDIQRG